MAALAGCATHGAGCAASGEDWLSTSCDVDEPLVAYVSATDQPVAAAEQPLASVTPLVYENVEAPVPRAGGPRLPAAPHVVHHQPAAPASPTPPAARRQPSSGAAAPAAAVALTGVAAIAALGLTTSDAPEPASAGGPDSLEDVPASLRDLAALQRREQQLADESLALKMERRAVLRVGQALRRHREERSAQSKLKLDDALREHAAAATVTRGLDAQSDAESITQADNLVGDRIAAVMQQRKSTTRLVTALMLHQAQPTAGTEEAVVDAVRRYSDR